MKNISIILTSILLVMATTHQIVAQQQSKATALYSDMIVEVNLNGQKAWALLDPSTDFTIINRKEKSSFNFNVYQSQYDNYLVKVMKKNYAFEAVGNAAIELANVPLFGATLSCNLNSLVHELEKETGKRISLIIGSNMMKHHGFILDLGNNRLTINKQIGNDNLSLEQSYSLIK